MKTLALFFSLLSTSALAQSGDTLVYNARRAVRLEGGSNFRDLGGYPAAGGKTVKWGRIYRSADISKLTDADLGTLQNLHLNTVCDLRGPQEMQQAPDRMPTGVHRVELTAGSENVNPNQLFARAQQTRNGDSLMRASYTNIDHFPAKYQPLFDELLRLPDGQSLLFHCTAGKDRTGIGAALVLSALGVEKALILKDYQATDTYWQPAREAMLQRVKAAGVSEEAIKPLLAANPAYLESTFTTIESRYGSVDRYLTEVMGLTAEKKAALRAKFLN
jgi:protein-tyrosine phosphatase